MSERKLLRPESMEDALSLREHYQEDALPIAGGQSLLVLLRNKLIDPKFLIDLERLRELRELKQNKDSISVGAMTTIHDLSSVSEIRTAVPILSQAASKVGSTAIRNLGTIGGNICHNEPGADLPPALLALDARVELRGRKGIRKIELSDFFCGYFETAVAPDELVSSIEIPRQPESASAIYLKHAISPEDLAIASAAVVVVIDDQQPRKARGVRIALGGVAPVPFRAKKAETVFNRAALSEAVIQEAAEVAASEADPITDPHGSAEYRRKMVKVLVRRAISAAIEQTGSNDHGKT
jgi:aerobic carbon-monoxide dehydrogenase medium subunit